MSTVSGWHLNPAAVAMNRHPSHSLGMGPRIHAEAGHVSARQWTTRKEALKIVEKILKLYEKDIPNAPVGKSFGECYDIIRVKPTDEYLKLWEKGKKRLGELGLDFTLLYGQD